MHAEDLDVYSLMHVKDLELVMDSQFVRVLDESLQQVHEANTSWSSPGTGESTQSGSVGIIISIFLSTS